MDKNRSASACVYVGMCVCMCVCVFVCGREILHSKTITNIITSINSNGKREIRTPVQVIQIYLNK